MDVHSRGRLSGTTTKKIRTDHALLTRENEKLARKLDHVMREQQAQPGGKQVTMAEEDHADPEVRLSLAEELFSSSHFRLIHRTIVE